MKLDKNALLNALQKESEKRKLIALEQENESWIQSNKELKKELLNRKEQVKIMTRYIWGQLVTIVGLILFILIK